MGTEILKNKKIWFDGLSLSGASKAFALNYGADAEEVTTFDDDTHIHKGGLLTVAASITGFFDADPYDAKIYTEMGTAGKILTWANGTAAGSTAYTFKSMLGSYSPGAQVGNMLEFNLDAASAGKLIRGSIAENQTGVDTTGDGTGVQLGSISASQKLYVACHVLNAAGTSPTMDLIIESDDNASFTSATTRATFTQFDAIGGEWKEVSGAIADDYWRASWTIGGTDPDFDFVIVWAIQ